MPANQTDILPDTENNFNVYTFFDSETWGVFYGYNQILIILTILISSYFLSKDVQLYYKCYKFLNDIHKKLAYIIIAIHRLRKHYKYKHSIDKQTSFSTVKNIKMEMIINVIDAKCDEMIELVENIREYFKNQVNRIVEEETKNVQEQINSILYHDTNNDELVMLSIRLDATATTVDSNKQKKKEEKKEDSPQTKTSKETITNTPDQLNPVIVQYVTNEMSKYDIIKNKRRGFLKFLSILWNIRAIMFMACSHVFDTASDIALSIEWYILYQRQLNDSNFLGEYNVDMSAMFWCCIGIIFYYRISSSWEIYKFSHSFMDVFLQFFFDFYLIKLIYINVFKIKSYSPTKILKIMRSIEAQNESAFQSILTMVFLIKTNFGEFGDDDSNSSMVAILSFLFSFWSLSSRFIFLDFDNLQPHAQTIGINVNYFDCNDINGWCIYHWFFRLIEVLFSILIFSLIWVVCGGVSLLTVVLGLYLWLVLQCKVQYGIFDAIQNNFLGQLMVFDTQQIRIKFNLGLYYPYYRVTNRHARLLLFLFLACWLLFLRVVLCCLVVSRYNFEEKGGVALWCIIISIILLCLWFFMFYFAIKFYINRDDTRSGARTATNKLNGIDLIASNDEKSIIFCKELGIDVFTHKNYKKYHTATNAANNVLEAMIISNDIKNYFIIEEWYYSIGMNKKVGCDFEKFCKTSCDWNWHTIEKLVYNCDSLDYYKSIHDKLRLDMSLVHPEYKRNILHSAVWHGRSINIEIIEWILQNKIIDINGVDADGATCLHYLMQYIDHCGDKQRNNDLLNEHKIAKLFITHGVNERIKDKKGRIARTYLREMKDEYYDWLVGDVECYL